MLNESQQHSLTPLFDLCRQVIPYLDGKCLSPSLNHESPEENWLIGEVQDKLIINNVFNELKTHYPEAGQRYYMTRTWELLCWQPMYISFIAIYGLQARVDLSTFMQPHQDHSIYTFRFVDHQLETGEIQPLIIKAASQLNALFEHYRQSLDSLVRVRPGYVKRLNADLILSILMKLPTLLPHFSQQDVFEHARLWLKAMHMPEHLVNSLSVDDQQVLQHARTSCCLTYEANNTPCDNCPKLDKLQSITEQTVCHER